MHIAHDDIHIAGNCEIWYIILAIFFQNPIIYVKIDECKYNLITASIKLLKFIRFDIFFNSFYMKQCAITINYVVAMCMNMKVRIKIVNIYLHI